MVERIEDLKRKYLRICFYQNKLGCKWGNPTIGMVAGNKEINCKNVKK